MVRYTNLAVHCTTLAVHCKAATIQILDFSICVVDPTSLIWAEVYSILQITHGAAMFILVIVSFVRESLQMYRMTRQWQCNQYVSLLVKQGILYFLVYVPSHVLRCHPSSKTNQLPTELSVTATFCLASLTYWLPRERVQRQNR